MLAIRRLVAQRHLALMICVAALMVKLLVPSGYMMAADRGAIVLTICSGVATSATPMPGMGDDTGVMDGMRDHVPSNDHGKVEMPCAYAGLSAQILGAVDPSILMAALAVVVASASSAVPGPGLRPSAHLRPPLRGPPLPSN